MTAWAPSPDELQIIAENSNTAAAAILRRSKNTIRRIRDEYNLPNPITAASEPEPTMGMPRIWPVEEIANFEDDLWLTLEQLQQHMRALDTEQAEVDVTLTSDGGPVLIAWLSDLHLGHTECNMTRLRRDLDRVKQTPHTYVILGGDLMDNVVTSVTGRGMSHQQLTPVRIQKHLIDRVCEYLGKEKTLAMLLGNHEAWSMASDDFDPIAYFAQQIGCPYLGAQGFVNISLGSQQYRILAAHQFRMRSGFILTHQAKRLEDFSGDADVTFVGHTHESSGESTQRRGQRKFYGQAGSYLQSSRYGKQLGFKETWAEMPGVLLWPDRKKVLGVHDAFEDGIAMLRAFR